MFGALGRWLRGEMIEVEIVDCRREYNGWCFEHTLVMLPDMTRRYVMGHLGKPGEKIKVNTWDLHKYG